MINEKTYVEIRGRKTFLLEGLERITEYGDTRIAVSCGEYSVEYIEKHRTQSR